MGYALGHGLTYTPHVIKPVVKEIEVPVKTITYRIKETGCTNFFGFAVPCHIEGEARRKRAADEEAAAPAPVLTYAAGLPLGYGYGLGAYGYGLPYTYAAPAVTVAEPKVTEVEVPQYVYKAVNEKVELLLFATMDSALLCLVHKLSRGKWGEIDRNLFSAM